MHCDNGGRELGDTVEPLKLWQIQEARALLLQFRCLSNWGATKVEIIFPLELIERDKGGDKVQEGLMGSSSLSSQNSLHM